MKDKFIIGLLVLVVVLGVANLFKPTIQNALGAQTTVATKLTDLTVTGELDAADVVATGGLTLSGDVASTGNNRLASLVQTGSIATFTTTSTATAANVCDNHLWIVTATSGTPTITLPSTTTLFADCLTTNGDFLMINLLNGSATTGTIFAAGTGGTLLYSSSTTVAASKGALLRVVRNAATTYTAGLINLSN